MIRVKELKRAQTFTFRGLKFEVIVCISQREDCLVNVVVYDSMRNTMVIQMHKNFEVEATGDPKIVPVISIDEDELKTCKPYREKE